MSDKKEKNLDLDQKEVFLLLLIEKIRKIYGRTRIQKLVFLFQQKYDGKELFSFKPYYYGPYSKSLKFLCDDLIDIGLLEESEIVNNGESGPILYYSYFLTDRGEQRINEIKNNISNELELNLEELIHEYGYLTQKELLREVYSYAEYTDKSVIKELILGDED